MRERESAREKQSDTHPTHRLMGDGIVKWAPPRLRSCVESAAYNNEGFAQCVVLLLFSRKSLSFKFCVGSADQIELRAAFHRRERCTSRPRLSGNLVFFKQLTIRFVFSPLLSPNPTSSVLLPPSRPPLSVPINHAAQTNRTGRGPRAAPSGAYTRPVCHELGVCP